MRPRGRRCPAHQLGSWGEVQRAAIRRDDSGFRVVCFGPCLFAATSRPLVPCPRPPPRSLPRPSHRPLHRPPSPCACVSPPAVPAAKLIFLLRSSASSIATPYISVRVLPRSRSTGPPCRIHPQPPPHPLPLAFPIAPIPPPIFHPSHPLPQPPTPYRLSDHVDNGGGGFPRTLHDRPRYSSIDPATRGSHDPAAARSVLLFSLLCKSTIRNTLLWDVARWQNTATLRRVLFRLSSRKQ